MPKWCRNIFVFGALTNGGHRLSSVTTIAPAMMDMSESILWRKYNGVTPSGREAKIEDVGRVAENPRYGSLPKLLSSWPNETPNSALLKLFQRKDCKHHGGVLGGMRR
jgi:hypothetical protein